jgi:assimilatory nitrate reductase catalytic subunit
LTNSESHQKAEWRTTPAFTYEKIAKQYGVFWPCPSDEHPGTPRLFEPRSRNVIAKGNGPFYFPDGKARFNVAMYSPPAEDADAEYPFLLTTGRVISHFLSGTQTRRIGPLVDQCPDPFIEVHPVLAQKLGLKEGDWATADSRRGTMAFLPPPWKRFSQAIRRLPCRRR